MNLYRIPYSGTPVDVAFDLRPAWTTPPLRVSCCRSHQISKFPKKMMPLTSRKPCWILRVTILLRNKKRCIFLEWFWNYLKLISPCRTLSINRMYSEISFKRLEEKERFKMTDHVIRQNPQTSTHLPIGPIYIINRKPIDFTVSNFDTHRRRDMARLYWISSSMYRLMLFFIPVPHARFRK